MHFKPRRWGVVATAAALVLAPALAGLAPASAAPAGPAIDAPSTASRNASVNTGVTAPDGGIYYVPEATATSSGATTPTTLAAEPGPCELYPSVVHQRESGNYEIVGNKPYTKCTVAVTSINQQTQMYKTALAGIASLPQGKTFPGGNRGEKSYTQQNVEVKCANTKSTTWFAEVAGTVVYDGKTYVTDVETRDDTYPCGT